MLLGLTLWGMQVPQLDGAGRDGELLHLFSRSMSGTLPGHRVTAICRVLMPISQLVISQQVIMGTLGFCVTEQLQDSAACW
jgi:hypothetical protein